MYAHEFMNKGGNWLGRLRERVQTMFRNGDMIHWGSDEQVSHTPSIRELEELGSYAVAGYHNEKVKPLLELLEKSYDIIKCLEEDEKLKTSIFIQTNEDIEHLLNRICYELYNKPRFLHECAISKKAS